MKQNLLFIIIFTLFHTNGFGGNGTQPDYGNVIVGSRVVRTIAVLTNDILDGTKNYQLFQVYKSTTSPGLDIGMVGNSVTYRDTQKLANPRDTFFYIVKDLVTSTFDTNFVVITKADLPQDLYPGDANRDNICNHIDVLSIGIAYGKSSQAREGDYFTDNWTPVRSYDWSLSNLKSNYRFSDANGDGMVDSAGDIGTVWKNYNKPPVSTVNIAYSPTGGEVFKINTVDTLKVNSPSSTLQIKINLGTASNKVANAYGISFTLKGDIAIIQSAKASFKSSKWFSDQAPTLDFYKVNDQTGEMEITIVRKNGKNDLGSDELCTVDVVVQEELGGLAGGLNSNFEVTKAVLIDSNYNLLPVTLPSPKPVYMKKSSSAVTNTSNQPSLNYFITGNDNLIIENKKSSTQNITIYNVLGKLVNNSKINGQQSHEIDVNSWSKGIYFIRTNSEVYKLIVK